MGNTEDLTVVLPLKDRFPFTVRWLRFANQINFPFKVLIADSSKDERVAALLSNPANFPNIDYEYVQYPYDETYTQFYTKLADALERVETPFVVHTDNDDFCLPEGIKRSLEFLRNHPDFSSCRGTIAGIVIKPDERYGELSGVYGDDILFRRDVYPPGSTLQTTAAGRVADQFAHYRANWYDVYRTEQSRAIFRTLRDLDTKDIILAQHVPMLLGVIAGKVQRDSSYCYLVRQIESPYDTTLAETRAKGDDFDRMLLDTWSEDFKGFLNAIARAIAEADGISIEEARRQVKEGYRIFMAPTIIRCLWPHVQSTNLSRDVLRRIYRYFTGFISGAPETQKYIRPDELTDSDGEFRLIYELVTTPHASFESLEARA